MQAIKLGKKYPDLGQDEIFELISKFKYVASRYPRLRRRLQAV